MTRSIPYITTLIVLTLFTFAFTPALHATGPPPPPQSGNNGGSGNAPPVPIDGGISLLLAAGAALGGKKLYDLNKKNSEEEA